MSDELKSCPDGGHCQNEDVVEELRAENERLRAALAWYADPENYLTGFDKPGQIVWNVMYEGGERARKALKGGK